MDPNIIWQILSQAQRHLWCQVRFLDYCIHGDSRFAKWMTVLTFKAGVKEAVVLMSDSELALFLQDTILTPIILRTIFESGRDGAIYQLAHHKDILRIRELFVWSSGFGKLDLVKWLTAKYDLNQFMEAVHRACQWAAGNGHLRMLQWLIAHFAITKPQIIHQDNYVIHWAISAGHLEILQWLTKYFNLSRQDILGGDNCTLGMSAIYGHVKIFEWIDEQFNLTRQDILADDYIIYKSLVYGQVSVTNWLIKRFNLTRDIINPLLRRAQMNVLHNNQPDILRLLYHHVTYQ